MWRGRLSVALDALETEADSERAPVERHSPMETTNVQLPTGDRLQIPTGAETLRLKSYLIMCRNTTRDFAEFAELVDSMETQTAAVVLAGQWTGTTVETAQENNGSPPSWYAAWPIRNRPTSTTPGCRAPRRRLIGPRSGSAAYRWR